MHITKLQEYDREEHHNIALKIEEDSIVLLKNENNILPLKNKKIALIGDMAKSPRYQGAGSSTINPYRLENAYDCFIEDGFETIYAKGYERIESPEDEKLKEEAIKIAKENEIVVIFAGLTENYESEGMDRTTLDLPKNQNELITQICKVNKNVIVVLSNGSPITMPWQKEVKAIITGYLGGEAGARAIVNCLIGKVNPSGKLAETYPLKLEDTPCYKNYPGTEVSVEYQEAIFVGYRYYDTKEVEVLYPFGYGMSYTDFEYSNLHIEQKGDIVVSFSIKNNGNTKGKEIAQVYISQEQPIIFKAKKELKAFEKVELNPGEEKKIVITLTNKEFEYYNVENKKWEIEPGTYNIMIGKSSRDIVLKQEIIMQSKENMQKTIKKQNVNKATKVMMDLQKPLKKFYEKKSSNYTKEMVEQLIQIAKTNSDFEDCKFLKEYIR